MNKEHKPAQSGHNNNSPSKDLKQLKDDKLAAALRANLRRRKTVTTSLKDAEDKGSSYE